MKEAKIRVKICPGEELTYERKTKSQKNIRLLPKMTLCLGNIGTFRLGHRTNYQASATAFLRAPCLISMALLTWLCSPYYSIMGDISYAIFVDSHRIPSSLLFWCGFLYRDPAGMAAQKPYSSTGAGLVLRGRAQFGSPIIPTKQKACELEPVQQSLDSHDWTL
nr:hypothetical protein [Tanacetum cinerariifolium]